jgi:putative colanic acid biosynthesis UDP-glucose lipid carrier transferase
MWLVTAMDFVLLNAIILLLSQLDERVIGWSWHQMRLYWMFSNFALMIIELKFHTIIHERMVSAGDVVKSVSGLTIGQALLTYLFVKHSLYNTTVGSVLVVQGVIFFIALLFSRLIERNLVKRLRRMGRNIRTVTMVGANNELHKVYDELVNDPTMGYRVEGYYADEELEHARVPRLGTLKGLIADIDAGKEVNIGDELYVSLSRRDGATIKKLSQQCDRQVTKFFFVPVSVESIGLNLKREYINNIEVFATYEIPLENPMNVLVKRVFDIVVSIIALFFTGLLFPFIYIIIKTQSPGPIFFKQLRTGLDGKDFLCYKFRSMHVNKDADKLQATKDDPRKYPFGNFMRKANIDELPQFWNVLKGDMSIVGPRPHMLAHTEMYSHLIGKYMVRHFVKPGVTGWAQVTGFRGETKELWQMEERVKRDIWYIEHWTIWLDIRIVWLTFKTIFVHDKNAY